MKDALENGQEMLTMPMRLLPVEAKKYLDYLCKRVGMCIETCLTAYTAYSQYILNLPCDDDLYKLSGTELKWWEDNYEQKVFLTKGTK